MSKPIDLKTWFQDASAVAAVVPGEAIFSLLKRSFQVPVGFIARSADRDGAITIHQGGETIAENDQTDVLFVRSQPVDLALQITDLTARDKFLCQADARLRIRILPERAELDAFQNKAMGSVSSIDIAALIRFLQPTVEEALRGFTLGESASDLVDAKCSDACAAAVAEALRGVCFESGLAIDDEPEVLFRSPEFARVRNAEQHAARKLGEHEAHSGLRQAIATAQTARLEHLESMLTRLKKLADDSPDVELPELMRAFDESQRSQLYEALFESRAKQRTTQWIAVVTGSEVLFFDPQSPRQPVSRVAIDHDAGGLRSVQIASSATPNTLLIGAARGVYELTVGKTEPEHTYLFEPQAELRGGVNAAAANGDDVVATHSEQGVIHWNRTKPEHPTALLADLTAAAKAIRHAQFADGRFWCSIDRTIASLPADNLHGAAETFDASDVVTGLYAHATAILAGTAMGDVLRWARGGESGASRLYGGTRRPAESVCLVESGGVTRLFFADTSLAVSARVVGDTFTCRYEAGGQTIRRAEAAADIVAAVNDARDRVMVWTTDKPEKPAHVIPISRITGRSVQDICLVPVT